MRRTASYFSYFLPFLLIIAIGLITIAIVLAFISQGIIPLHQKRSVILQAITPTVELQLKNSTLWEDTGTQYEFSVQADESIKTSASGSARLSFDENNTATLGPNTQVTIVYNNHDEKSSFMESAIEIHTGKVALNIKRMVNPKSSFTISTEKHSFSSRGGRAIFEEGMLHVLSGEFIYDNQNDSFAIGVGQSIPLQSQMLIPEDKISTPAELSASAFYSSLDAGSTKTETPASTESATPSENTPAETHQSENNDSENNNNNSSIVIEGADSNNVLSADTEPVLIQGQLPENIASVSINNYTLTQFTSGAKTFSYRAKQEYGNLRSGENTYDIVATTKEGKEIRSTVTLQFTPKTETTISTEEEATPATTENTSSQKEISLAVTSHTQNQRVSEDPVTISGTAPLKATKIVINDYTLQSYKQGSGTWKYNAAQAYENLVPQSKNDFLITAYDSEGNALSSITFSFFSTAEPKNTSESE